MSGRGRVEGVRKIAVLRANAIGDFVFTLPALDAIRRAYPDAEIVLLGLRWHAEFLAGRPGPIDRVVPIPSNRGVHAGDGPEQGMEEDREELGRFFRAMRRERFDIALQMHGGGRHSNPFVLRLGAGMTAGLRTPDAPRLDRWIPYIYFQSEVARYLEVAGLIGAAPVVLEPRIAVTPGDLEEAGTVAPGGDGPLAAIHPGSGGVTRRWPVERFAAVGDVLARRGVRVVVTGAGKERPLAGGVIRAMREPAIDACGRLSLRGLAGLLSRCAVVVSNDSGPLHLAAAVGAPTVGIYWCTNLFTAGTITRSRHRPAISWTFACPVCGADLIHSPCGHPVSHVTGVETEEVAAAAVELLEVSESRPSESAAREGGGD